MPNSSAYWKFQTRKRFDSSYQFADKTCIMHYCVMFIIDIHHFQSMCMQIKEQIAISIRVCVLNVNLYHSLYWMSNQWATNDHILNKCNWIKSITLSLMCVSALLPACVQATRSCARSRRVAPGYVDSWHNRHSMSIFHKKITIFIKMYFKVITSNKLLMKLDEKCLAEGRNKRLDVANQPFGLNTEEEDCKTARLSIT